MDRKIMIALTCTLVLTALSLQGAATEQQEEQERVLLTRDGFELVPGGAVPMGANQIECGGTAPEESYCETGLHVAPEVWAIAVSAHFSYTGTTEVRLLHPTSVLVMQVNWVDGNFAGGQIYGSFPPAASVFWHECFSYELGTGGDNPIPLPYQENGTPGGSGDWGCFVLYP